jgi:hypothetical protein
MHKVMLSYQAIRTTTISSSSAFIHQHQLHRQLAPPTLSQTGKSIHHHLYLSSQNEQQADMPNGIKKENLPTKVCVVCGRPFNWRKKWERVWDEVTTCSKSCNKKRKGKNRQSNNRNNLKNDTMNIIDEGDDNVVPAATLVESNVLDGESLDNFISTINNNDRLDICDDEDSSILALKFAQDTTIHDDYDEDDQSTTKSISSISSPPNNNTNDNIILLDAKQQRKLEKKRKKAERRAQRQGKGDPTAGQKQCTICNTSVNLLIRCTYDKSGQWGMVCGKCWNDVRYV